jgi:hypothetical protein
LDGLLQDEFGDVTSPAYLTEQAVVQAEAAESASNDWEYWGRLYSALYYDDVQPAEAEQAAIQEEWREHARYWRRHGKGASVIVDFKKHQDLVQARLDRRRQSRIVKDQQEKAKQAVDAKRLQAGVPVKSAPPRTSAPKPPPPDKAALYEPVPAVLTVDVASTLLLLDKVDALFNKFESHRTMDIPPLEPKDAEAVVAVYNYMLDYFCAPRLKMKYGYCQDHTAPKLAAGQDVPAYFANVKDQSIHRRKVLSMAGLRNLVVHGPSIYREMKDRLFVGDPAAYSGDVGSNKMKRLTGNVVDLDTTVLRCSDRATLNAINEYVKVQKGTPFANAEEFGNSDLAADIAINTAKDLLQRFSQEFKLTEAKEMERKIHVSQVTKPIQKATSNTDRGKWPVWRYTNVGVDSYHANVPTMEEVNGALLKAPFHCAKYFLQIHALFPPEELDARLDAFFEDCVADTCFNQKWRSIEEFGYKIRHEGTIVDVLQRTQAKNQDVFTAELFRTDDTESTKEIAAMVGLVQGLMGKDKTGLVRQITKEDVTAWVKDPAVVI